MEIRKRNGEMAAFDAEKIRAVMRLAFTATDVYKRQLFDSITILQNVRQNLRVAVRKAHTAAPDPFADFRGRLRLCCT